MNAAPPGVERPVSREDIDHWAAAGHLDAAQRAAALAEAGLVPNAGAWRIALSRLFLFMGTTLLIAALGYFVAYNWSALGRIGKFGLLQAVVVLAVALALLWLSDLKGRAALLAAVLATGPLLAFLGQTYQTGADTYELFRAWALLVLPWVLVANWRPVYAAWILIVNLAVQLYFSDVFRPFDGAWHDSIGLVALLAANGLALLLLETFGSRIDGGARSAERLCIALVLASGAMLYLLFLFDSGTRALWQVLLALAAMGVVGLAYRKVRLDVPALALWCFAAIVCAVATCTKLLAEAHMQSAAFLVGGLLAIGLSVLAANGLRELARQQGDQS